MTRRQALGVLSSALVVGAGCLGTDEPAPAVTPAGVPGQPHAPTGPSQPSLGAAPGGALSGVAGTYYGQTSVEMIVANRRQSASDDVVVKIAPPAESTTGRETNPFNLSIKSPTRAAASAKDILPGRYSILSAAETFRNHNLTPDINAPPPATFFRQFWTLQFDGQTFSGIHEQPWDNIYSNVVWYESVTNYGTFVQPSSFAANVTINGTIDGDTVTATIEGQGDWVDAFRITLSATRPRL